MRALAVIMVLLPLAASAATITVNTTADSTTAGDGQCTLREAIANVNAAADTTGGDCSAGTALGDTIIFVASSNIGLTHGQLEIQRDVTVIAPPGSLRIAGAHRTRVFEIAAGTTQMSGVTIKQGTADHGGAVAVDSGAILDLTNCTLSGNSAFGSNQFPNGPGGALWNTGTVILTNCTVYGNYGDECGGIFNAGTVTLTDCTVSRNVAGHTGGGGIFNLGAVILTNSTVTLNRALYDGGGIAIAIGGTLTLTNSTVSGNRTIWGVGAGIYNGGTATFANSTISGNYTILGGGGGGIFSGGTATLSNCTISGNRGGGGIVNNGPAILTNCTISGNHAKSGGGGGIFNPATTTVTNTIVANNTSRLGKKVNCGAGGITGGHNLDSDGTCFASGGTDLVNTNPQLALLRNNGGLAATLALCTAPGVPGRACTAASPAIDAGDDAVAGLPDNLTTDQRGQPRLSGAHVDIGAYEVQ